MQTKALIATPFISLLAAGSLFFGGDSEPTTFSAQAPEKPTAITQRASVKSEPITTKNLVDPTIVRTVREFNEDLDKKEARQLAVLIENTADKHEVDPLLVTALVSQESAFDAEATSPVGAIGLGQLMPFTADDLGVDPYDPAENLEGAVKYLAQNLDLWADSSNPVALALASYNAGPGAVQAYDGVPPYQETEHYVEVITSRYDDLKSTSLALQTDIARS